MKHIKQAGGIVLNSSGDVLIVTSKIGRLTFPKGSREQDERPIDNAIREIYEETGLKDITLKCKLGVLVRPGYTAENTTTPSVIKHIDMFLFTTDESNIQPQDPAIKDARWIRQAETAGILSWPEEADFFNQHLDKLVST